MAESTVMEQIVSLCKRRGFIYPASEIYGGLNGFWDYGPLGVLLKNNIRDWWWHNMVDHPADRPGRPPVEIVGLDSSIIQNPKAWVASGHVGGFSDPMVDDRETKQRYRADHLCRPTCRRTARATRFAFMPGDEEAAEKKIKRVDKIARNRAASTTSVALDHPAARRSTEKSSAPTPPDAGHAHRAARLQPDVQTYVGAIQEEDAKAYLRPETAQGIFLNYKNVLDTMRVKVPFGVAQVGKSFRNEVTPRNFIFRSREFEQMEIEWFCHPDEAHKWFDFWLAERMRWWRSLGVSESNLPHPPARTGRVEPLRQGRRRHGRHRVQVPVHRARLRRARRHRPPTDFDLRAHEQHSGQRLDYFDQELQVQLKEQGVDDEEIKRRSRYYPHVIEPASGLTRAVLVLLCEAFTPDESRPSKMYMKFDPKFAPIKCGIFPLVNKDGMPEIAEKLYLDLRKHFTCEFDAKQNIGKRYARNDEIGTPFCVTMDGQTLQDQTVTIRDRDTMSQDAHCAGQGVAVPPRAAGVTGA